MKKLIIILGIILMKTIVSAETKITATTARPSEQFRSEHIEIKKHLAHVEQWTGELSDTAPAEQKKTMQKIVTFFNEHIKPHAEWEERKLYPAVDKRTAKGSEAFTSTMRYEHRIVGRWIEELDKEAKLKSPDTKSFSRKTDQLLGLIKAHFEEEEEVLLPILDKSMTPAQFKEEIISGNGH